MITTFIYILACGLIIVASYWAFKKYIRPRYPIRVTCWFCGESTSVPFHFQNNWDCQACEQYNGFKEDGDYNKVLPAQYDERYNNPVKPDGTEYLNGPDVLCARCSQNQLLKVKQLASFVPFNEKNFDAEAAAFKQQIEKAYRLCLACEIKVKKELDIQNEALAKRFSNLDYWHRLAQQEQQEEEVPLLHSSYTDRHKNNQVTASILLHMLAFVCSVSLLVTQIDLASVNILGTETFRSQLHPYLVELDKLSNFLLGVGLSTGILAKLVLGKYRLYIMDAVCCPVWLLVLLSQTGFLHLSQSGSLLICLHTINTLVSVACLSLNRKRRNLLNLNFSRQALDTTDSCSSVSSISPFSSISQVPENRPDPLDLLDTCDRSNISPSGSKVFSRNNNRLSDNKHMSKVSSTSTDENRVTSTSGNMFPSKYGNDDDSGSIVDNAASDLLACNLGTPKASTKPPGYTLANFLSNLNNESVNENLRHHHKNNSRPVICPGRFTYSSAADRHTTPSPFSSSRSHVSTFSPTSSPISFISSPQGQGSTLWRPSPQRPSAFNPLQSLLTQPPIIQRNSPSFSQMQASIYTSRHNIPNRSTSSLSHSQNSFIDQPKKDISNNRKRGIGYNDTDSDTDEDCNMTSVTSRFPDSTSTVLQVPQKDVPFWQHPALIGFLLGGSVVANIMLLVQSSWSGAEKH